MFKTRNQCNLEAIKYNSRIAENLKEDQDYCIRGMVEIKGLGLFIEVDYYKLIKGIE